MKSKMWTFSQDEEYFCEYEYFETKEECIKCGREYECFNGEGFYVGEIEDVNLMAYNLGEMCIETIANRHYVENGDISEDLFCDVKNQHIDELDNLIERVVLEWATKHNYMPNYYTVNNIEYIEGENND